jgi:plasmid stabilization system protein ParE
MSSIHLHIDRIVLRGFEATDPQARNALVQGLETELTRLMADPAMRASLAQSGAGSRRTPVLRAGKVPMAQDAAGARRMGIQIARSIGKGIAR